MKRFISLVLCLMPLIVCGITLNVALDGSQSYTSIQTAINESNSGDVVLVYPGRYLENLNMSNKTGIILGSLEYSTGDTTYINTTIIDGSNGNNSTILCYENTVNCTIRGFSITGGSGYRFLNGTVPYQIFGGGIFINDNNNVTLFNMRVFNNKAASGGGIAIFAPNTVNMSNVDIFDNFARYLGGGLDIGSDPNLGAPNIIFDQVNRCSIYNNFAQWGMDIHWHYIHGGTLPVYLKKFTVPQWEKYYADFYDSYYPPSPYTVFDIQESFLQPVEADLYVSPNGNDSNDGLTPSTALLTPSRAMQRIASNPDNHHTVHLLAGEHRNIFDGEYIPIAIKDYTILQGISQTQTSLYAEDLIEGTGVVTMGIERYGMTLKDLSITTVNASAIFSWGLYDSAIENVTIANSTVSRWLFYTGYITSTFSLKNVTMQNNTATLSNFGMNLMGSVVKLDTIVMKDNQTLSLPQYDYLRGGGGFDMAIKDTLIIRNSKFINNLHHSEDGWANFRVYSDWTQFSPTYTFDNCLFANNTTLDGARNIDIFEGSVLNLVNCTFANNSGAYLDYLLLGTHTNRIVNCLFSNNNSYYEIRTTQATTIENCLFSKTDNIWRTYNAQPLSWGENNLIGSNPLFSGTDPSLPSYYYLYNDAEHGFSPALNAGTTDPSILPIGYQIPEYDAFGYNRIFDNNIDIGCFESPGYTDNEDTIPTTNSVFLFNYPNPFNPCTTIEFAIPKNSDVRLIVYNTKGQQVKKLVNGTQLKGNHKVVWDGTDNNNKKLSSGMYLIKLENGGNSITRKSIILK